MKKKSSYRWLIWIILAVVLIGVALMHILPPYIDRWKSARDYDKLAEEYVNDESEPDDGKQKKKDWWATDVKVEFDKLKAENLDVIGWIRFDNQDELGINYPILYSGDNQKYLRTDLHGNSHIAGCIFLEGLNKSDFSDYYNIIYGHNMKNNTMFGSLPKYSKQEYYEEHSVLYLLTPKQNYKVKLIAGYVTPSDSKVYEFEKTKEERSGLLKTALDNSLFTSGTTVSDEDRLLTLSTCSYEYDNARFVLMGILKEIG